MITVTYEKAPGEYRLRARGHAGYGKPGQDIVCAAVSALLCTLGAYLEEGKDRWDLLENSARWGELETRVRGPEALEEIFAMTMLGLGCLAARYPRHLTIQSASGGDPGQ